MGWLGAASLVLFGLLAISIRRLHAPIWSAIREDLRNSSPALNDKDLPRAQVILCVRGRDPFLESCLDGLAGQDYPAYSVMIVLDAADDDAAEQIDRAIARHGTALLDVVIRDRNFETCTRKASSLYCALEHLSDDVEVVATCDADTIPHPAWLRELVAPLQKPDQAVSTGNRWFRPSLHNPGSLCRYYWNALALPMMVRYRIPWGGSLAMRQDVFRNPDYVEGLKHAFCEDTYLAQHLATTRLVAVPVITLIVVNAESTSLKWFWGFLNRQMLGVRLHHPAWKWVLTNAVLTGLAMWGLLVGVLLEGAGSLALWAFGLFLFGRTLRTSIARSELMVQALLEQRRFAPVRTHDYFGHPRYLASLILTGVIYPAAMACVCFAARHEWRGVTYGISRRGVRVLSERRCPLPSATEFQSV